MLVYLLVNLMRESMKIQIIVFLSLLAISKVAAQGNPSEWALGLKGGGTKSWLRPLDSGDSRISPTFALSLGRQIRSWRVGIYADAFYEGRRMVLPGTYNSRNYSYLSVPLYVRTGKPGDRLHVQLGGFYSKLLTRTPDLGPTSYDWQLRREEWGAAVGFEVRLGNNQKIETTINPFLRYGLTSTVEALNPRYRDSRGSTVIGITLAGYLNGSGR